MGAPAGPKGKASRDKRDIYYRKAKEEGWRARSAFKLLQIDEAYDIFKGEGGGVSVAAGQGVQGWRTWPLPGRGAGRQLLDEAKSIHCLGRTGCQDHV